MHGLCQVWYFISKSQPGLRRSDPLKSSPNSRCLYGCWLATLKVPRVAARFWRFRSRSASRRRVYVASASRYPSQTRNCARLLVVATQSSRLNCRSRLSNVAWQQCRRRDVIIAHVISADAQIYILWWFDLIFMALIATGWMYNTLIKAGNDMDYIGEVRKRMTLSTSQFQMSLKIWFRALPWE